MRVVHGGRCGAQNPRALFNVILEIDVKPDTGYVGAGSTGAKRGTCITR